MANIKHRIHFSATKEAVFEAVAKKEGLQSWWTSDVEVDENGYDYIFGFNGHSILLKMKVLEEVPTSYVEWECHGDLEEWTDTRLIFEISKREDGVVILNFTHADWKSDEKDFPHCNTDWGHLMYYLKDYVEGRNNTPMMS